MAASLTQTLIDKDFRNWIKGALAVLFARQGLTDFVQDEITDLQNDLLNDVWKVIGIPAGTTCNACTTANVLVCPTHGFCTKGKKCTFHDPKCSNLKPNQPCPHHMCTALRDAIFFFLLKEHRYRGPSWKNTDARGWCSDAYQLAKCFMPPDGYADKASLAETDFNGLIAVVINNKRFEKKLSVNFSSKTNICEQARIVGREIRHSATHQLSDKDLVSNIDVFIQLLSDPVYLVNDAKAVDAVQKLKQLKTNTLTIHADDITSVLNDSIKATFNDQQNALIREIQQHFNVHKKDSVEAIDLKVQEFIETGKVELNAQTEQGKDELNSKVEKGKGELSAQTEQGKDEINSKVEKGKGELNAQSEQGKDEINSKVEKGKGDLSAQTEQGKGEINSKVEKGKGELSAQTEQGKDEINLKVEKGKGELSAQTEQGKDELNSKVEKGKGELSAQTDQGKDEINSKVEKGKGELNAQSEQGKDELNSKVEKGKGELSARTEQGKDEINSKVKKGKDKLSAQTEQGKVELSLKVEKGNVELRDKTEQALNELHAQVRQGAAELKVQTSDGKDELSSHIAMGKHEVEAKTHQGKEEIAARGKQVLEEISRSAVLKTGNDDSLLQDLKEDLMTYYRENESMIPAAPLVDEHKVPIEELYVLPPMWAYDKPLSFGLGKNTQTGEQRSDAQGKQETSVSQLFLSDKNVRYRKIYITADAGFGKTSLSQKLTMTWCQSHSPLTSLTKKYKGDELAAMRYFDFLFLLHLRDYQSEPLCNLDDLIIQMLSKNLSRNTLYTKEFLQRLLHDKTCLILLDGLDEWAHPDKCRRTPSVPHNNHPDSCTVLTTSRPWKLGTIGLSEHNIDRHIEISELDRWTGYQLKENAIRILNERNLNRAGKRIEAFDKAVKSVEIGDIIYNPYILLQLMCVFFGGLPIGKSKCEIYSNITEFTLERGLNKKDLPNIHVQTNDNAPVPNCMNENETCKRYYILLMKLGELAFYTLFSEKRESSLIFDRRIVTQYMTEQEIEFCLKVGLLCQTKDSSIIAVKRYHVFFQHKSVQEFFSAIYITSEWQNESVKSTILNVCSSLSGILELSNVFVFVCGINPEVYTCISGELQTIVDLDDVTRRYRTYMDIYNNALGPMLSYQSMQVQCLQESVRNGNDSCSIHLHDYILRDYILTKKDVTSLKIMINFNKGNVKSLQLSDSDQITEFMKSLDPGVFTSLETLRVDDCEEEPVWLADILTESARTLKCLTLPAYDGISLSAISITALTGLTCLQSLYLDHVNMTHSNVKCFYAYISQTTTLTQLKLTWILCSDHEDQYRDCDITLDLHCLNELKMLHLYRVQCRELHVNPACLEKLKFRPPYEEKMTGRASATLWQDLRAAPVLSSLTLRDITSCQEMIQTIPTLTQLQHLKLEWIDMGDVIPRVSPEMTHLEHVELQRVTMSSAAWRTLFFSIGQLPRSITVKLSGITMTSQEWREAQCRRAATSGHGGVILLQGTIRGGMEDDCECDQDNADIITITRFKYRQLGGITDSEKQD